MNIPMPSMWWDPVGAAVWEREDDGRYVSNDYARPRYSSTLPEKAVRLLPEKDLAQRQADEIRSAALDELATAIENLLGPRYDTKTCKLSALNLVIMAAHEMQGRAPVDIVRKAEPDDQGRVGFPEPLNRHGRWNYLGGQFRWEQWAVEPGDPE